jgi:hypothetical protein
MTSFRRNHWIHCLLLVLSLICFMTQSVLAQLELVIAPDGVLPDGTSYPDLVEQVEARTLAGFNEGRPIKPGRIGDVFYNQRSLGSGKVVLPEGSYLLYRPALSVVFPMAEGDNVDSGLDTVRERFETLTLSDISINGVLVPDLASYQSVFAITEPGATEGFYELIGQQKPEGLAPYWVGGGHHVLLGPLTTGQYTLEWAMEGECPCVTGEGTFEFQVAPELNPNPVSGLQWASRSGSTYEILSSKDLSTWEKGTKLAENTGATHLIEMDASSGNQEFYRVLGVRDGSGPSLTSLLMPRDGKTDSAISYSEIVDSLETLTFEQINSATFARQPSSVIHENVYVNFRSPHRTTIPEGAYFVYRPAMSPAFPLNAESAELGEADLRVKGERFVDEWVIDGESLDGATEYFNIVTIPDAELSDTFFKSIGAPRPEDRESFWVASGQHLVFGPMPAGRYEIDFQRSAVDQENDADCGCEVKRTLRLEVAPRVTLTRSQRLTFTMGEGIEYQLQGSNDGSSWQAVGDSQIGTGHASTLHSVEPFTHFRIWQK